MRCREEDQERISQLLGQMEALETELRDTRLQLDLLEAEVDRLDKVLLRKDEQIDRLQQGKSRVSHGDMGVGGGGEQVHP